MAKVLSQNNKNRERRERAIERQRTSNIIRGNEREIKGRAKKREREMD